MAINAEWHRRHRMPARATLEERVAWHAEHQRHCACRPIPEGLRQVMARAEVPRAPGAGRDTSDARNLRGARLLNSLKGGDRRSLGRAGEAVRAVLRQPTLLSALIEGMVDDDPLVRMRAADTVEKVTRQHPEWLVRFKPRLLGEIAELRQPAVRWHVAQMLPRLPLDAGEERRAVRTLLGYLRDESRIVQTCSMQALAEFARRDPRVRARVRRIVRDAAELGTPAMRSRGRRLLATLVGERAERQRPETARAGRRARTGD